MSTARRAWSAVGIALVSWAASAADFPAPQEGVWIARDFKFHTGEVYPELRVAYKTIGASTGEPVLILHGTAGSSASMLTPGFAGELFGAGQPLDAGRYFIIIPDAIGAGKSSKPSDGLRAKFPRYNYDDMVDAQYRLVSEHLKVKRLRAIVGNSMGGMQAWLWAQKYPAMMDIAVPMASLPTEMASRNWILRRLITDSIRNDPEWMGGNYATQPKSARFASVFFGFATNGGNLALYKAAPTREKADQLLDQRLKAPFTGDANDILYQWDSSRDYNPSPGLEKIEATLLAINAADDERNPPETGVLDREIKRVKHGRVLLIPASEQTSGHGTTGQARHYKKELGELLQSAPRGIDRERPETCKAVSEADIAALFDRWNRSLQTGDPRKVVAHYAERSVLLATVSNTPRHTRAQKEDYFHHFLENKPSGTIDARTIEIGCNSAVDAGLYTFTFAKTGARVKARYTYTYKWDGKEWLITSHHSSAMPEK